MAAIPKIREYMTPNPHTIEAGQTARAALRRMQDFDIRHLPVIRGGRILGVVSERDLRVAEHLQSRVNRRLTVGDMCTHSAYAVAPDAALDEVLERMIDQKLGSAVVEDGGTVIGIFTAIDALRCYKELLHHWDLQEVIPEQYVG